MSRDNLLIVGDSERDANLLRALGMFVSDPCVYLRVDGRAWVALHEAEVERGRREARGCRVISLTRCLRRLERQHGRVRGFAGAIGVLARQRNARRFWVPANFPLGLARELRRVGVRVRVKPGAVFPDRETKSLEEVRKISAALVMAEVGMAEGVQALRHSKVASGGRLLYHNAPLTAEKLRGIIDTAVLQAGGFPGHTIVACGRQSCSPHEPGHGPLRAHQPIVIDVFPRSRRTGYWGDVTRTVVKGRAAEALRRMYDTVRRSQELAFSLLRPSADCGDLHAAVERFLAAAGYKTRRGRLGLEGFIHATGHGLGLELHEPPQLGSGSRRLLQAGHVVTIEPGLYYASTGGVRLEDVALVTPQGARNLTEFEKVLEVSRD